MKTKYFAIIAMMAVLTMAAVPAFAQAGYARVSGKVTDMQGVPIQGAIVEMFSKDTGKKYTMKTDKRGEYSQLGIAAGTLYTVTVSKDGNQLWQTENFRISSNDEQLNFDLRKLNSQAPAKGGTPGGTPGAAPAAPKMTEEQKKQLAEYEKEKVKIKGLNDMLAQARVAQDAGNLDQAIVIYNQAIAMDPTRDLLHGKLGDAYLAQAKKATDAAARKESYNQAVEAFKKAISLSATAGSGPAGTLPTAVTTPDPQAVTMLGAYYNNMGEGLAKTGRNDEAIVAYNTAATTDPANAGNYYFNLGATLTNANKSNDAIIAFDKALAINPMMADAFYLKGVALLGKATMKGDKMEAPAGTAEAFNKYLELKPDGAYAQPAKDMLAAIGAKVETHYGKRKK